MACASSSCKCDKQSKIHLDLQWPEPWCCWLLQIDYHLFAKMVRTLWIIMNSYIKSAIYGWHTNWVEVRYVRITVIYAWHTNWVEVSYVRITESDGITILYHHIYLLSDKLLSGKFQQDGFFFPKWQFSFNVRFLRISSLMVSLMYSFNPIHTWSTARSWCIKSTSASKNTWDWPPSSIETKWILPN